MPRHNPHSSTLARLRAEISAFQGRQFTQADLAKKGGCARITIQSVERGKLGLSEKLARAIAEKTGAGVEWLMRGDPASRPKDAHGRTMTREVWLAHQSDLKTGKHARTRLAVNLHAFVAPLASIASAAAKSGRLDLFLADMNDAVSGLVKRYGKDEQVLDAAVGALRAGNGVMVHEPDFFSVPDDKRFWRCHARGFGRDFPSLQDEVTLQQVLSNPAVYAVSVEVLPMASKDELAKHHPASAPGAKTKVVRTVETPKPGTTITREKVVAVKPTRKKQGV